MAKPSCEICRWWRKGDAKADEHEAVWGDAGADAVLGRCLGQRVNVLVPRDDGGPDDLQSRCPLSFGTHHCEAFEQR